MHEFCTVIWHVASGTPWWAYLIFGYLLFAGIRATQGRTIFLPTVFIMPLLAMALNFHRCVGQTGTFMRMGGYVLALIFGGLIGWLMAPRVRLTRDSGSKYIVIAGSYQLLILSMLLFAIKYLFGYLKVVHHEVYMRNLYLEVIAIGIISGLFWGKSLYFIYRYFGSNQSNST